MSYKSIHDELAQAMSPGESWTPRGRVAISLNEAGYILGIGQTLLFSLIKQGKLKVIHVGRRTLVPVGVIKEILQFGV